MSIEHSNPHEEHHVELWRIPNGQTLHHLMSPLLFFPLNVRWASDHDADEGERVDVRPEKRALQLPCQVLARSLIPYHTTKKMRFAVHEDKSCSSVS